MKAKTRHFLIFDLVGMVGSKFSIYTVQDNYLGQNKMEQQASTPAKSRIMLRES